MNLTAAEYVFLLDPWWNPAVEAQAIDRTPDRTNLLCVRYRLIAQDTVEEKVLQLQKEQARDRGRNHKPGKHPQQPSGRGSRDPAELISCLRLNGRRETESPPE